MDDKIWEEVFSTNPANQAMQDVEKMESILGEGGDVDLKMLGQGLIILASLMEEEEEHSDDDLPWHDFDDDDEEDDDNDNDFDMDETPSSEEIVDAYKKAIYYLEKAAVESSDDPEIYDLLGSARLSLAIRFTEEENSDVVCNLYQLAKENFSRAAESGFEASKYDLAGVCLNLTNVLRCDEKYDEAARECATAIEIFKPTASLLNIASHLNKKKIKQEEFERLYFLARAYGLSADIARFRTEEDSIAKGIEAGKNAISLYQALMKLDYDEYREEITTNMLVLADLYDAMNNPKKAFALNVEATTILEEFYKETKELYEGDSSEVLFKEVLLFEMCVQRLCRAQALDDKNAQLETIRLIESLPNLKQMKDSDEEDVINDYQYYYSFMMANFPDLTKLNKSKKSAKKTKPSTNSKTENTTKKKTK